MDKIKVAGAGMGPRTFFEIRQACAAAPDLQLLNDAPLPVEAAERIAALGADVLVVAVDRVSVGALRGALEDVRRMAPGLGVVAVLGEPEIEVAQEALSAGAKNVLVQPVQGDHLARMILEAHSAKEPAAGLLRPRQGLVITVYGTKGGCGKTTIAANLAVALQSLTQKRVVAVDLDLEFGDLAVLLQQERHGHHSLFDAIEGLDIVPEKLLASLAQSDSGRVSFLPSLTDPVQLSSISQRHVQHTLETLRDAFDYVVIDSHQSLDSDRTLEGLDIADVLLIVTTPDIPTLLKTGRAFDTLDKLGYGDQKVRLVANRSNTGNLNYVEEYLGHKVDYRVPSNGTVAVLAANKGIPFTEGSRKSDIRRAIFELARSIAQSAHPGAAAAAAVVRPPQRRWFGRVPRGA